MDPRTILDYAMFQLTPTRTRCELVVYSGPVKEKIASGLFEPFVCHLKFVNDEISKGGYSIKLLPPTKGVPWFSKATFERFVRFVSSPAILERFVGLEREIQQTESSYEANKLSMSNTTADEETISRQNGNTRSSSDSTKLNGLLEGANNKEEENSKVALQHLLESRIAMLRREQAMAYARGLVAGFQYESIDDLIHFANAFGASRLREACINFKELWKKKHVDDVWIEEVAAVQSCLPPAPLFSGASGIVLANEISAPNQDSKINNSSGGAQNGSLETSNRKEDQIPSYTPNGQIPMPWQYSIPPYVYHLQSPLQQMPSFQGYPLANMQSVPPYLPKNMQWPSNHKDSNVHRNQKSSGTRKEKSPYKNGSGDFEDSQSESSDPDSGSESNSENEQEQKPTLKVYKKKSGTKQPSRRIIIRNINYISPKRNGNEENVPDESCADEDDSVNEDSIKQNVDIALESLQKVHKAEKHANRKIGMARGVSGDADDQDPTNNLSADASEVGNKNENWDVFQNLLKIDDETETDGAERRQPVDIHDEHFNDLRKELDGVVLQKPKVTNDSFIVPDRDGGNEGTAKLGEYVDGCGPVTKSRDNLVEDIVFSHRMKDLGSNRDDPLSGVSNSSVNKSRNSEDWFVANPFDKTRSSDPPIVPKMFDGDYISSSMNDVSLDEKRRGSTPIDDSFMIQGQLIDDSTSDSHWKTDMSIVADLTPARKLKNNVAVTCDKHELSRNEEPNDLCVVLQRDLEMGSVGASWTMKMNNEIDFSFSESDRRSCISNSHVVDKKPSASPEKTKTSDSKVSATRKSGKDDRSKALHGSLSKGRSEIMSRNKKPASPMSRPLSRKSKLEKEEEIRKKTEEMVLERQRRIAERTAASGLARAATKKDQLESKTARGSVRSDKNKVQSIKEINRINTVKVREN